MSPNPSQMLGFRTDYGWWAHPEEVDSDYSWGPYLAQDVAEAALSRGTSQ